MMMATKKLYEVLMSWTDFLMTHLTQSWEWMKMNLSAGMYLLDWNLQEKSGKMNLIRPS